jgi:hypothetical protein
VVITDAPNARGGSWGRDGTILFAPGVSAAIVRVPSRGGPTEPVTRNGADTGPSHRWPHFLPDGRRFLFSSALGRRRPTASTSDRSTAPPPCASSPMTAAAVSCRPATC